MQKLESTKEQIIRCVLFLVILAALLFGLSALMVNAAKKDDGLSQERNKSLTGIAKEPRDSIDMLVLGDSLSYSSVSPPQLWEDYGIPVYICGQPGQQVQEAYYLLETALEKQSPKMIFIETNFLYRKQTGISALKATAARKAEHMLPVFRFHNIWKSFVAGKRYDQEDYKGFVIREGRSPYKRGEYMKESQKKKEISDSVDGYMNKILSLCKDRKVEVVLFSAPSPNNYNYRKHNAIQELADRYSVKYLDLNLLVEEIGINWIGDSLDGGDHLNLSGAVKVTDYLGNYLALEYQLPDHRGERAYTGWTKMTSLYHMEIDRFF